MIRLHRRFASTQAALARSFVLIVAAARTQGQVPSRPIRLCAGGDVTLGSNLDPKWARAAADTLRRRFGMSPLADSLARQLTPFFGGADLVLLNIEGAIGSGPVPPKCSPRSKNCYAFRMPPAAGVALRRAIDSGAVIVGNVANNHSHDAGEDGRDTTVARLKRARIFVVGADTIATPVALPSGDTIAMLGFHTDSDAPDARDLDAVRRHVRRAADRYPIVVVTMHLGAEGPPAQRTRNATELFLGMDRGNPVGFADAAFSGGATLVIGHGPHVLRAAEWRDDRLVFYSLGNLLTYGPFNMHEPTNRGAVACATIDSAAHVSDAELRPTMQAWPGVLQRDQTHRAWSLIDSLSALDFPTSGARVDSTGRLAKRGIPIRKP
jgi:poly-gamma-glutamate capsule biosynthesis protein CapA/YwtB (metallophosphatase superfamily)